MHPRSINPNINASDSVRYEYVNSYWGGNFKYEWFGTEPVDLEIAHKVNKFICIEIVYYQ